MYGAIDFDKKKEEIAKLLMGMDAKELPLEYFVRCKTGLCRHFSLAAFYFLEKLRKEGMMSIRSVELVRVPICIDGLEGKHAWLCVSFENASFHFDPYWGILADRSKVQQMQAIQRFYGDALL